MTQYYSKTLGYKPLNEDQHVLLDLYCPVTRPANMENGTLPVIVYFHAGGMVVGSRKDFLPTWLIDRVIPLGYAFISADYRLLIPGTIHETLEDLKDLFKYLTTNEFICDHYTFKADLDRIAVSGSSAGGLCAYLSAIHCNPKPKVVLSIYGMGGDFFTEQLLAIKRDGITSVGKEIPSINPADLSGILYPSFKGLAKPISEFPFSRTSEDPKVKDGYGRGNIFYFLVQRGLYLDYYTGLHEPIGISETLREVPKSDKRTQDDFKRALPEHLHAIFPQLCVDSHWPPTIILHGVLDDIVPITESRHFSGLVKDSGVKVELIEVEGENHGFDVALDAEVKYGAQFDKIRDFIQEHL
ncbi:hypothetical protein D9613_004819 [Agrocybe pediades]|uniref:Alpha/beta-hydrolase n=1 Tax=Agrocybe pediades TaxID=84607 RepID=A0A8H4R0N7_9AGAR|nr:hypothetical protein D9613_004819 [Agrocybe pediades]